MEWGGPVLSMLPSRFGNLFGPEGAAAPWVWCNHRVAKEESNREMGTVSHKNCQ